MENTDAISFASRPSVAGWGHLGGMQLSRRQRPALSPARGGCLTPNFHRIRTLEAKAKAKAKAWPAPRASAPGWARTCTF